MYEKLKLKNAKEKHRLAADEVDTPNVQIRISNRLHWVWCENCSTSRHFCQRHMVHLILANGPFSWCAFDGSYLWIHNRWAGENERAAVFHIDQIPMYWYGSWLNAERCAKCMKNKKRKHSNTNELIVETYPTLSFHWGIALCLFWMLYTHNKHRADAWMKREMLYFRLVGSRFDLFVSLAHQMRDDCYDVKPANFRHVRKSYIPVPAKFHQFTNPHSVTIWISFFFLERKSSDKLLTILESMAWSKKAMTIRMSVISTEYCAQVKQALIPGNMIAWPATFCYNYPVSIGCAIKMWRKKCIRKLNCQMNRDSLIAD